MLIGTEVVILYILIGLLRPSNNTREEISVSESLTRLLSSRPTHLPWIPSIAYETKLKNEYQWRQFLKDRKYERQIELILAELQAYLVGNAEAQEFFRKATVYGIPSSDNLKFYENFILSYDNRLKQPVWSLEHLTERHFRDRTAIRTARRDPFFPDMTLHKYFRINYRDYKKTNYYRVQFAPACDNRVKQQFLDRSYLNSNTAPQTPNINRIGCIWNRLESYVTFLGWRTRNLYVVTGALYESHSDRKYSKYRMIGSNRITVPTHFYKVLLYEERNGALLMEAYVVPNSMQVWENERLEQFRFEIDRLDILERLTGLKYFDLLDRSWILKPIGLQYRFQERFAGATAF